jgi:hypothetical protein
MASRAELERQLMELVVSCRHDPLRYTLLMYPWGSGDLTGFDGPDDWQREILVEVGKYSRRIDEPGPLDPLMIAVASGQGVGKTALMAWLQKWFMSTRKNPTSVVTANTMEQLNSKTWRELAKWNKMALDGHWFTWTATKFYYTPHPENWFASAIPWSENNSEAFRGTHERDTMFQYDEASAIADVIWTATHGSMSTRGSMWFVFGNPTRTSGRFYDCFHAYRKFWKPYHVDARNAKMADKKYVEKTIEMYGPMDDRTKVTIYGEFPSIGFKQLISAEAIEKARHTEAEGWEYMPLVLGVDVARFGDCETILQYRQGRKVFDPIVCPSMDLMKCASFIGDSIKQRNPMCTTIDEIGIGAGVLDRLRQMGFSVLGGNSGNSSENPRYLNKRAEAYFALKEYIEAGCELPTDKLLSDDLRMLSYDFTDKGRLRLDRKQDFLANFGRSPDRADALALTFFYPYGGLQYDRDSLEPETFIDT